MLKIKELIAKVKLKKQGLNYIKVSRQALNDYRRFVKDNYKEGIITSLIKINRNYQCSKLFYNNHYSITKQYGNLDIRYNKEKNMITSIRNINHSENTYKGARPFVIDRKYKKKFDIVLGKAVA